MTGGIIDEGVEEVTVVGHLATSGLLVETAYGTPQGFTIDETEEELGTHMCIPPHWEHRRAEISQLEPIETVETVVG